MLEFIGRLARQQRPQQRPTVPVEREDPATLAARELLSDEAARGAIEAGFAVEVHRDVLAAAQRIVDAEQQAADDAA
ncbi:MAG TPA: hypothetical protein VLK58_28390 [Conexibacter sp.]|nr:hypothetical protein [Conexibacter sp.]